MKYVYRQNLIYSKQVAQKKWVKETTYQYNLYFVGLLLSQDLHNQLHFQRDLHLISTYIMYYNCIYGEANVDNILQLKYNNLFVIL